MALSQGFLDELRARTVLSSLIGRTVKLDKAGREYKGCCPFHQEKSPSFTVNDEKGFYHCFGCGAHGDAMRWLQDHAGTQFMDAVRELAAPAGLELPAPDPVAAERQQRVETVREALETAQTVFASQLEQAGAVMEYLAERGFAPADIASFGIGYARGGTGSLKGLGIGRGTALAAGLIARREDGSLREMFHDRITIPIHDGRGQLIGFGARVWPGRHGDMPKFINSPDSAAFDKGRVLFNLHRAAPAARPQAENRLIIVEGYMDVIALARIGVAGAVAPMGTALTPAQLTRAWRLHHRPVLMFDGDAAGRKAALRACVTAMPAIGPGRELAVAMLPEDADPDDLTRADGGEEALRDVLGRAVGLDEFLFDAAMRGEV